MIGTLGLLLEAVRSDVLTKVEAKQGVQQAVGEHGLRISVSLYQRVLEELE